MAFDFMIEFFVGSAVACFVLFSFTIFSFIRWYRQQRGVSSWWDLVQCIKKNDFWVALSFFHALAAFVAGIASVAIIAAARRSPGSLSAVPIYGLEFAQVSGIYYIRSQPLT